MTEQNAAAVLTSSPLAPIVPYEVRLKHAIILLSSQRPIRLDTQSNARRRLLTQLAFLVAVTENKCVESHVREVPTNSIRPPKYGRRLLNFGGVAWSRQF